MFRHRRLLWMQHRPVPSPTPRPAPAPPAQRVSACRGRQGNGTRSWGLPDLATAPAAVAAPTTGGVRRGVEGSGGRSVRGAGSGSSRPQLRGHRWLLTASLRMHVMMIAKSSLWQRTVLLQCPQALPCFCHQGSSGQGAQWGLHNVSNHPPLQPPPNAPTITLAAAHQHQPDQISNNSQTTTHTRHPPAAPLTRCSSQPPNPLLRK